MVEDYVKDEIYFRESKRLGLDVDDAIIRRRLVQKLTFLTEDIVENQPVDEETLKSYFEQNKEDYRIPARFSFSHRFFSSDNRRPQPTQPHRPGERTKRRSVHVAERT